MLADAARARLDRGAGSETHTVVQARLSAPRQLGASSPGARACIDTRRRHGDTGRLPSERPPHEAAACRAPQPDLKEAITTRAVHGGAAGTACTRPPAGSSRSALIGACFTSAPPPAQSDHREQHETEPRCGRGRPATQVGRSATRAPAGEARGCVPCLASDTDNSCERGFHSRDAPRFPPPANRSDGTMGSVGGWGDRF